MLASGRLGLLLLLLLLMLLLLLRLLLRLRLRLLLRTVGVAQQPSSNINLNQKAK